MSLSTTIKAIQDIMRKDVGVDGDAQRIGQLVWILFLKIWDDREREIECLEDGYRSPLLDVRWIDASGDVQQASDLRWRTWAADDEGMTGDELLNFVNDTLFPVLKGLDLGPPTDDPLLHASRSRKALMRRVFGDAYQYMKSGTLLRQVLSRVNSSIDFNNSKSRHLFGDLYEQILRDLQGAGNAGEYYTPRAVTQLAVDLVDPRLGEVFLDPACGTGGFLACTIEHIRAREVRTPAHEATLQSCLRGVEKKPLPHLLAVTNMIVHGIDVPEGVLHDNTLRRALNDYRAADRVDVILTNPPFGGMEEDGIERGFPTDVRTRETADLFLVLIVELLKEGGRAAVVLPDGTLFGEGVKTRVKERLLSECSLHTIVRLPKGVFAPYTSIQTNLLFFTKGQPTTDVWFYEHPYPPGQRAYSKTRPLRVEEFDDLKTWWSRREEGERAWRWDFAGELAAALKRAQPLWDAADEAEREAAGLADELKALKAQERQSAAHKARITSTQERLDETRRRARSSRAEGNAIRDAVYNLDRRNPHAPEAQHDDPDELLALFHQAQAEATDLREQLRRALADALEGRA
jgi:type I restriction enzyme M protein